MDRAEKENVIRDQYAAVNERDWDRAMSHYAEDVKLTVPGVGLNAGTCDGKDAVGQWYGDWFATFDRGVHFDIDELVELDDGTVILFSTLRARGRLSGVELTDSVVWRYRLSAGKIAEIWGFESPEAARTMARERRAQ